MKKLLIVIVFIVCLYVVFVDVVVIVNFVNGNVIDEGIIKKIYFGKVKLFDDGIKVNLVN